MKQRIKDAIIVWLGGVTSSELDAILEEQKGISNGLFIQLMDLVSILNKMKPKRDPKTGRFVKKGG